jgi:hypothetical protein
MQAILEQKFKQIEEGLIQSLTKHQDYQNAIDNENKRAKVVSSPDVELISGLDISILLLDCGIKNDPSKSSDFTYASLIQCANPPPRKRANSTSSSNANPLPQAPPQIQFTAAPPQNQFTVAPQRQDPPPPQPQQILPGDFLTAAGNKLVATDPFLKRKKKQKFESPMLLVGGAGGRETTPPRKEIPVIPGVDEKLIEMVLILLSQTRS